MAMFNSFLYVYQVGYTLPPSISGGCTVAPRCVSRFGHQRLFEDMDIVEIQIDK